MPPILCIYVLKFSISVVLVELSTISICTFINLSSLPIFLSKLKVYPISLYNSSTSSIASWVFSITSVLLLAEYSCFTTLSNEVINSSKVFSEISLVIKSICLCSNNFLTISLTLFLSFSCRFIPFSCVCIYANLAKSSIMYVFRRLPGSPKVSW